MVAVDGMNAIGNLHGSGDEILHSDERFRDDDDNLHDGGKSVRVSVNDDKFSHSDDENEGRDGKGSDVTGSNDDGETHSVRTYDGGNRGSGDQKVNGDDKNGNQSGGDDNQDRRFRDKCF